MVNDTSIRKDDTSIRKRTSSRPQSCRLLGDRFRMDVSSFLMHVSFTILSIVQMIHASEKMIRIHELTHHWHQTWTFVLHTNGCFSDIEWTLGLDINRTWLFLHHTVKCGSSYYTQWSLSPNHCINNQLWDYGISIGNGRYHQLFLTASSEASRSQKYICCCCGGSDFSQIKAKIAYNRHKSCLKDIISCNTSLLIVVTNKN